MGIRAGLKLFAILATAIFFFTIPANAQRVWTRVSSGLNVRAIRFPTADTGYAIVGRQYSDAGDSIIRTTDGGKNWAGVTLPFNRSNQPSDLTFFGSSGWFTTNLIIDSECCNPLLLKSNDYGFHWSVMKADSFFVADRIFFKSQALGFAWGAGEIEIGKTPFGISRDGGLSWHSRSAPAGIYGYDLEIGQPNVIFDLPVSELVVYPSISVDTGVTWTKLTSQNNVASWPMSYIGGDTWISSNGWTTDNGQTWDTVETTARGVNGEIFTDTLGHGMFIGYPPSLLYFTNNYGHSWDSTQPSFSEITDAAIFDGVAYILAPDSANTYALWRSVIASSDVKNDKRPSTFRILNNPAGNTLELSPLPFPETIRISDCLGRIILQSRSLNTIDISSLAPGLYWVVTKSGALPFIHVRE